MWSWAYQILDQILCCVYLGRETSRRGLLSPMLSAGGLAYRCFCVCVCPTCRANTNRGRAQEVSEKLRDNRDLQHFLQNTQDVSRSPISTFFAEFLSFVLIPEF